MSIGVVASHAVSTAPSAYATQVLADSPLVYWRLGESSGIVAADSSGNGRDANASSALSATAGLLTGDTNGGLGIVANAGPITSIPSAAWMNVSSITVEAMAKLTSAVDTSSGDSIVSRLTNADWIIIRDTDGKWMASVWNNSGTRFNAKQSTVMSNGTIYHLAFTFDGTNLILYVNGTAAATTAVTGTVATLSAPIEVGRYSSSSVTIPGGTIDEVAVYGTALSAARIAAHYAAT